MTNPAYRRHRRLGVNRTAGWTSPEVHASITSPPEAGGASRSSRRERIPSLVNTLRRCHSTVRGLRKSRAPISGFDSPSRASSRDLPLLRGQIVARLDASACAPSRRSPAARCARARRTPPCRSPRTVVRGAQLLARVDAAVLAAQPLAVEQMRAGELGPQPGAAQPLDRFAIEVVCGLALAQQRAGSAPRCRAPSRLPQGCVAPPAARAHRGRARRRLRVPPPRRARASAHMEIQARTRSRWRAGPPTRLARSGRDRCTGPRQPSAPRPPPSPDLRPWLARAPSRSAAEASASLPCSARSRSSGVGRDRLPVAAATLSLSAISEAAPAKSPTTLVPGPTR